MQSLLPLAEKIAARLKQGGETVAVAESSTGGLISAALLALPGASAYFIGGAVVYTRASRAALLGITDAEMSSLRSASEPYALLCAWRMRERNGASWGLAETGAAGPTGNRYSDAPGHSCIAVAGPSRERAITLETGGSDRQANMHTFAARALELFLEVAEK
ncbi:MAG: CinA family protein [Pseudolabrys sp.]